MFAVLATVALVLRGIMLLVAYITTDSFLSLFLAKRKNIICKCWNGAMNLPDRF